MTVFGYDIETYPNIFTFVFIHIKTENTIVYEISQRRDDREELIQFLATGDLVLVGFNNISFDYPILHYILENPDFTLEELHNHVQKIVKSDFPLVRDWEIKIPQVDLLKINHYDNNARRTSLKYLEFTLRWKKVQDLPFAPKTIIPEDKFDMLIEYNINDVKFTNFFFGKCINAIIFREQMSKILGHNVMNYSDVKIGEYLNMQTYAKLSGIDYSQFKHLRTFRSIFHVKDLIPDFISFKTESFKNFLSEIRGVSFSLDDPFERHLELGDITVKFAKGGLHSEDYSRIVEAEGKILTEEDVGSMYPSSLINGNMYPEHLGPAWNQGIKLLYEERLNKLKPKLKTLDKKSSEYIFTDSKQQAYKLAMNGGGYGKTGSEFSWQYDPLIMLKVTFRGQLSLLMLMEEFYLSGVEVLSANTDGVVIRYDENQKEKVLEIRSKWEKTTKYLLETTRYSKIIFRDVNNYIADIINDSGERIKVKYKGCFEFDQEFHKNNSQRVVAIALSEYFLKGVPVEDVIKNIGYDYGGRQTDIYDYCIGVKKMESTHGYAFIHPQERIDFHDKVIRFYVSNNGYRLFKIYNEKETRIQRVVKGWLTQPFQEYVDGPYDINFDYYINECNKIIDPIEKGLGKNNVEQLKLF